MTLDETSRSIIRLLQMDGRRAYADIAKEVGLSEAAVRQRVRRLLEAEVIQIVAVTDQIQMGYPRAAMIAINVDGDVQHCAKLIGEIDEGFSYILDGMNAERTLIAAECIGDARWFTAKSSTYASEREVFGRPIGANQGVQFPIARGHIQTEAAALMVERAAQLYDAGQSAGRRTARSPISCSRLWRSSRS